MNEEIRPFKDSAKSGLETGYFVNETREDGREVLCYSSRTLLIMAINMAVPFTQQALNEQRVFTKEEEQIIAVYFKKFMESIEYNKEQGEKE